MSSIQKDVLFMDTERVLAEILPAFSEYLKSDEMLSQIEQVFALNISRPIDQNTYDDIKASLDRVVGDKIALFLTDFVANSNADEMKLVETILKDDKGNKFLRKLTAMYGVLTYRARQMKYYPNEWVHARSNALGDARRGFMIRTVLFLGTGQRIMLLSTPDSSVALAEHVIRSLVNTANSSVESVDGKEKKLIEFIEPQNIEKLEASLNELKKRYAQIP